MGPIPTRGSTPDVRLFGALTETHFGSNNRLNFKRSFRRRNGGSCENLNLFNGTLRAPVADAQVGDWALIHWTCKCTRPRDLHLLSDARSLLCANRTGSVGCRERPHLRCGKREDQGIHGARRPILRRQYENRHFPARDGGRRPEPPNDFDIRSLPGPNGVRAETQRPVILGWRTLWGGRRGVVA